MALPQNHSVREFRPGSAERNALATEITRQRAEERAIFPIIGHNKVESGPSVDIYEPHAHTRKLGRYVSATANDAQLAIEAAMEARPQWSSMSPVDRQAIFMRAADLLEGRHNMPLLAATMLGQSKTAYQAEIDASCELIDFLRFNVAFARQLEQWQPQSTTFEHNSMDLRPLGGFVFAASPFNFTAIAGNLSIAPALMGNTVVWKPSERSIYSAAFLMDLFNDAGIPPGVINFLPTDRPAEIGDVVLKNENLAGVHFTGSTGTFDRIWREIGGNIPNYRSYPRLVGETGGKDFIFAHASADIDALVTALVRGAFDYQGQKCSAASRAFIPESIFPEVSSRLAAIADELAMGNVADLGNFMGAVIDERAFREISENVDAAITAGTAKRLTTRRPDRTEGYFVPPTVVVCEEPDSALMTTELFGPVMALCAYRDEKLAEAIEAVDRSTPYALTGAIFAEDPYVAGCLTHELRDAAGNFYINDKPTGAVVGRQPFGGGRRSGTNDKAGSPWNLLRWTSPRTIKTTYAPPRDHRYPHMDG